MEGHKTSIKQKFKKTLIVFLLLKVLLFVITYFANLTFFQIFHLEHLGNPDFQFNDLYYKHVDFKTNPHFTRKKSVVLINSGTLDRHKFRLQLAKVIRTTDSLGAKSIVLDHDFFKTKKIGTTELVHTINNTPNLIVGTDRKKHKKSNKIEFKAKKGTFDFPNEYTIREYFSDSSTLAYQAVSTAFPEKVKKLHFNDSVFKIHYCTSDDGVFNVQKRFDFEMLNTMKGGVVEIENQDKFEYWNADYVLQNPEMMGNFFKNKIVIIGYLGSGKIPKKYDVEDKHRVPVDTNQLVVRDRTMYGAVIHANAIENLLHPETMFFQFPPFLIVVFQELIFFVFTFFVLLHYGKFINILSLLLISIPYTISVIKLMDYNIFINLNATLLGLLFIEELYEIIEPLYLKIEKKWLKK